MALAKFRQGGWASVCGCALFVAWAVSGGQAVGSGPSDVSKDVATIFSQLEAGSLTYEQAQRELIALPSEEAIPALIEQLANNPRLQESRGGWPTLAYIALESHNAVQTEIGYQQFVACLGDSRVRGYCAAALLNSPEERQPEVRQRVGRFLADEAILTREKVMVIRRLGDIGPAAAQYIDDLVAILNDEKADRLRGHAAYSMLRIAGLEYSLRQFQGLAPPDEKVVMGPLARFIVEQFERYNHKVPLEFREALVPVRQFVLKGLKSEDLQVRSGAFEALPISFGEELVIEKSPGDYRINPEFEAAIKELATGEADPGLRERAQGAVGQLDDMVRAVLRRRERRASQDSGATPTKSDQDDPAPVVAPQEQPEPGP